MCISHIALNIWVTFFFFYTAPPSKTRIGYDNPLLIRTWIGVPKKENVSKATP